MGKGAHPKQIYRLLPATPDICRRQGRVNGQAAHLHNPLEAEVGLLGPQLMARADYVIGQGDRITRSCGQFLGRPSVEVEGRRQRELARADRRRDRGRWDRRGR